MLSISRAARVVSAGAIAFQFASAEANDVPQKPLPFKSILSVGLPGNKGHVLGQKVDACVVDLWDTSYSVTDERFNMERMAFAKALDSDELGHALKMLPNQRIAMNIATFDSNPKPLTGWVVVDAKTRHALADQIRGVDRPSRGYTQTDRAVTFALEQLESCAGDRSVIDLVTDGRLNFPGCKPRPYDCLQGLPIALQYRDEAAARGVTINVLAIQVTTDPGLGQWARDYMATPGYEMQALRGTSAAFNMEAAPGKVFEIEGNAHNDRQAWISTFSRMRQQKLIEEIAQAPVPPHG